MKTTPYLRLERRIAADESGGVVGRWRYGRLLLDAKTGRKKLPDGLLDDLVSAAETAGLVLSRQEIQRRIQCAEAYESEADCVRAGHNFGSWSALRDAGFPPVEADGSDPDDVQTESLGNAPDEWTQLQFDIPGLKQEISVRGRKVPLVRGEDGATVADVAAYLEMCQEMHENFGKTVGQIRESLATMREASGGDDETNAVEAWEAALADTAPESDVEQTR